jgi:hypothetical protein
MKYLKPTDDDIEWTKRLKHYWAKYSEIKKDLDPGFDEYYRKTALHDDTIESIELINEDTNRIDSKVRVVIRMIGYMDDQRYRLIYENVRKLNIHTGKTLGTYITGEIRKGRSSFSHEFITSNGGNVVHIHFGRLLYDKE